MESAELLGQGQMQPGDMDLQRKILSTAHLLQHSTELNILLIIRLSQGKVVQIGTDPVSAFCNKCLIYWEFCYQVAEDKNVTKIQGQTTRLRAPFY